MTASPPHRAEAIAALLAGAIADGSLVPGVRLPSRRALATTHGASLRTVQAALAALAADRLVEAVGGCGTRVAAGPPNRERLGVAFVPILEGRAPWSRFYAALRAVSADERCADCGLGTSMSRLFPGAAPPTTLEPWPAVAAAARGHRLLGVLFTGRPHGALVELLGAPAIAIDDDPIAAPLPRLQLDNRALVDLAVARLRAAGCRRLAALVPPDPAHRLARRFLAACGEAGIPTGPERALETGLAHADGIAAALLALLHHRDGPPDGLLLADDHLAGPAQTALRAWRGPRPVVVVHGNAPLQAQPARNWCCVGFDARDILAIGRETLRRLRTGEAVTVVAVPPRILSG